MILQDQNILIIGGTGSLGKVLTKRILSGEMGVPKQIIIMSRDEAKQHQMRLAYLHLQCSTDEVIYQCIDKLKFQIGDVRNYADVCRAIQKANIVINAAALKQVPTCEYFPAQAVQTNCQGSANIVRALRERHHQVHTVVGISTDKAVKPMNVMGMTKAIQERILIAANVELEQTKIVCVRYGNVLASRGSVIPLFLQQIAKGGPITLTDERMTRFLLSLDQAVDTVFAALQDAEAGEIYIPIVPTALITNVAQALIAQRDIAIKVTGIRPGEKLHETLVSQEEYFYTRKRGDYYVIASLLPELASPPAKPALTSAYTSADNVLSLADTKALLAEHNLLDIKQVQPEFSELLV